MKDTRITVRLPAALRRRLSDAARLRGERESDMIRHAVEHALAAEDTDTTAYDRARKAGIIGVVANAPPDLSTNRKYFAGFGAK
jgi:metal-responsive CopG/Arc/MetJ family transcriptional regulator